MQKILVESFQSKTFEQTQIKLLFDEFKVQDHEEDETKQLPSYTDELRAMIYYLDSKSEFK